MISYFLLQKAVYKLQEQRNISVEVPVAFGNQHQSKQISIDAASVQTQETKSTNHVFENSCVLAAPLHDEPEDEAMSEIETVTNCKTFGQDASSTQESSSSPILCRKSDLKKKKTPLKYFPAMPTSCLESLATVKDFTLPNDFYERFRSDGAYVNQSVDISKTEGINHVEMKTNTQPPHRDVLSLLSNKVCVVIIIVYLKCNIW